MHPTRVGKPEKITAGSSQSAVSTHTDRKLTGREKCGRKRCTSNRDDCSLQKVVKEWSEVRVSWTVAQWSTVNSAFHLEIEVPESKGGVERHRFQDASQVQCEVSTTEGCFKACLHATLQ